ncbi:hypothetical protein CO641_08010 [Lysobacteraceae bacterium NML91-0213]|nr:hypothetical protein CO641_08010 [Xanthomonadaceae bacterium NML91-0213]
MSRSLPLAARVTAALLAMAGCTHAQDARDAAPPGSAVHTQYVVNDEWAAAQTALAEAHERLLATLDGNADRPSRLARAVRWQQERWFAYREADCTLIGMLSGAGGDWPAVHGMTCQLEHARQRIDALDASSSCLSALPPGGPMFKRRACLGGLVDEDDQGH